MAIKTIPLEAGAGGDAMHQLLSTFMNKLNRGANWNDSDSDSATYKLNDKQTLYFTTDSFVANPIKFGRKNIGDLAISGTINDLIVAGATPIGISLALIIEEGFLEEELHEIIDTINRISKEINVPIVTGDTKVMEKGSLDKIIINTSGIGISENRKPQPIEEGDSIIISGGIAEHAVALLSKRFDFQTTIESDSKPLISEMKQIRNLIKLAKDPTRGGVASTLNEIAEKHNLEIELTEKNIPIKKEVNAACRLLGLDPLTLANEGRLIAFCKKENANEVLKKLKQFNNDASIIGQVAKTNAKPKVVLKTELGSRIVPVPSGKIVPRIC